MSRAPGRSENKAPKVVRRERCPLDQLSVRRPESGWRDHCDERVAELEAVFYGGQWGMGLFADVCILGHTDCNGAKIIDDGLCTIMALQRMRKAFAENGEATPQGESWPANLVDIFEGGVPVVLHAYEEDTDLDLRVVWNASKHDEECNKYRKTALSTFLSIAFKAASVTNPQTDKGGCPKNGDYTHSSGAQVCQMMEHSLKFQNARHFLEFPCVHPCKAKAKCGNEWSKAPQYLLGIYGSARQASVYRWIRAARFLSKEVVAELNKKPEAKGTFVWDNPYLMGNGATERLRLAPGYAVQALQMAWDDEALTAKTFTDTICKPLKLVESWETLMLRKFGVVARGSTAFGRVVKSLRSPGGLKKVLAVAASGTHLHGSGPDNVGIVECFRIKAEMEKCKAGGLPPPAILPDERQVEQQQEADSQALSEASAAPEDDEATAKAEFMALSATGVEETAEDHEAKQLACALAADLGHVHFFQEWQALQAQAEQAIQKGGSRTLAVMDCPTSRVAIMAKGLDALAELWKRAGQPQKFRVVVFCHTRFDAIAKVHEKVFGLWPSWKTMVVQVTRRTYQSVKLRPSYVVVCGHPAELQGDIPTTHLLTKGARTCAARESLQMRCTEKACPLRPEGSHTDDDPDLTKEISPEDKDVDILAQLQAEADELGMEEGGPDGEEAAPASEDEMGPRKRDYLIELWPFSLPTSFYEELFRAVGRIDGANVGILLTGTAHPASWIAMRRARLPVYIWSQRLSAHALAHAMQIAKRVRSGDLAPAGAAGSRRALREYETMEGPALHEEMQPVGAWDVAQGPLWYEGLNKVISADAVSANMSKLLEADLESFPARIKPPESDLGRGLVATRGLREGEVIAEAAAFFFDDLQALRQFLALPGNRRFADRIVEITGLKRESEVQGSVMAVLIGLAQFVQHYVPIRKSPNATWEFNAALGFNRQSLTLKVCTRNACGIAAGADIVVNYGANFDFRLGKVQGGARFTGVLESMFQAQKKRTEQALSLGGVVAATSAAAESALPEAASVGSVGLAGGGTPAGLLEVSETQPAAAATRPVAESGGAEGSGGSRRSGSRQDLDAGAEADEEAREPAQPAAKKPRVNGAAEVTFQGPFWTVGKVKGKWAIKSSVDTNKKVPKWSLLAHTTQGQVVKKKKSETEAFVLDYTFTNKTLVYDKATSQVVALEDMVEKQNPKVKSLYGCAPLAVAGALPKGPVSLTSPLAFDCSDGAMASALRSLGMVRKVVLCFSMKFDAEKAQIFPVGVAIVSAAQIVLPGGGHIPLEE